MMTQDGELDVVCLGGGVAGGAIAVGLQGSGLTLAIVERELVGGERPYTPSPPSTGCSEKTWQSSPRSQRRKARPEPDATHYQTTEVTMNAQISNQTVTQIPSAQKVDLKLEIVIIPVSDVDRAKHFYERLGWRLDADFAVGEDWRVVQLTPPGSPCSIIFGKGITTAAPGSVQGTFLVVSDIQAARAEPRRA